MMKRTLHTLLIALILTLLPTSPLLATNDTQIVLLYSEVSDQTIYNTYLVDCDYEGKITITVSFTQGGIYITTVQCNWRITTPGEVSIAWLDVANTGEQVGPLFPVGIGEPATTVQFIYLPLVTQ